MMFPFKVKHKINKDWIYTGVGEQGNDYWITDTNRECDGIIYKEYFDIIIEEKENPINVKCFTED